VKFYFVDTSALAKRYFPEIGSSWVLSWILPSAGNTIVVAELAFIEMASVIERRKREGKILSNQATILHSNLYLHMRQEYLVSPLDSTVVIQARRLVRNYPLRSLDAIQLASAKLASVLLVEPVTFVSADRDLLAVATSEGFTTDDPNLYL